MVKKVVLNNFDDLVEAFPNMTLSQIIGLYKQVIGTVNELESIIEEHPEKDHTELVHRLEDSIKAEAFLSTYLARYCCKLCGF